MDNELDVVILAENRLYLIECKTKRFGDEPEQGGAGADAIYKLDHLADIIGGLQARAMLVSYQPVDDGTRRRARAQRIELCAGAELRKLEERLKTWIR
jgi:hypothetical protein